MNVAYEPEELVRYLSDASRVSQVSGVPLVKTITVNFSSIVSIIRRWSYLEMSKGSLPLIAKTNSRARCENFHPITIFESTHCQLAGWPLR